MLQSPDTQRILRRHLLFDVIVILLLSLVAEGAHFSIRQGRAVICGDSAQHVDGARALLSEDQTPNFGFRKPGYTLLLAGLGWLTGNMSWSAVVANHALLALLPLAAYGLGCNLRGRGAGWIAALLVIAQLQVVIWGGRIMSEPLYACLLSFGILVFAVGLPRPRLCPWMFGAGVLLGGAWLTRSVGVTALAAAGVTLLWSLRHTPRRIPLACICFVLPVAGAWVAECSLNHATVGRFRTSTGSLGIMLQTRARFLQGFPLPATETTDWFLELLPERTPEDAYLANKLDGCVARCRARHDLGLDEWECSARAAKSGWETLSAHPGAYLKTAGNIFVRHLLRQEGTVSVSSVPPARRLPIIVHEAAPSFAESQDYWYAYWFLPHRSVEESVALVNEMRVDAEQRAPFGHDGFWEVIRYVGMLPVVVDVLGVLRAVGALWPGFALLLCGVLGLNRRTCLLLALAYVLEALIVAACGSTDLANTRYQFVWTATDIALVACLAAPVVEVAGCHARTWLTERNHLRAPAASASRGRN